MKMWQAARLILEIDDNPDFNEKYLKKELCWNGQKLYFGRWIY